MTLPRAYATYNEWDHDQNDCQSEGIDCDHCIECGAVVERYTPAGLPTCESQYEKVRLR